MIIRATTPATFLGGLDFETHNKVIRVALYRAADENEIRDLQATLYVDGYADDGVLMLREWDDLPDPETKEPRGEQYNADEFLAGCHVWGFDLHDHYDGEDCVTVYIYREGL